MRAPLPAAALLVAIGACVHAPAGRSGPPAASADAGWETVADRAATLLDEPAEGRVHVLGPGLARSFGPAGEEPAGVSLQPFAPQVAGALDATVTAAGTPRWRLADGWHGPAGRLPAPALPEASLQAGALLVVPLVGPGTGLPRVVCVFAKQADLPGPGARLTLRGETVLAVSGRGLHVLDLVACESRPVPLDGRALDVAPALDPSGALGAVVVARDGAPALELLEQGNVVKTIQLTVVPRSLVLDAGAVFVAGADRVVRLPLGRPTPARVAGRDETIQHHRTGLFLRLTEALEAADAVAAVDTLDVLALDGLAESVSAEEKAQLESVAVLVGPPLAAAARQALADGHPVFARVLSRRAALAGAAPPIADPPAPALRLAVRVAEGIASRETVEAERAKLPFERVAACAEPGPIPCVQVSLEPEPAMTAAGREQALAANLLSLRAATGAAFDARGECLDDGPVVLDETSGGPRSTFLCDLKSAGRRHGMALAGLLAQRERLLADRATRAEVRLADGSSRVVALPPLASAPLLREAIDIALALQGEADRAAARGTVGRSPDVELALRTLVWRGAAADDDIRAAIRGDGTLRPTWLAVPANEPAGQPKPPARDCETPEGWLAEDGKVGLGLGFRTAPGNVVVDSLTKDRASALRRNEDWRASEIVEQTLEGSAGVFDHRRTVIWHEGCPKKMVLEESLERGAISRSMRFEQRWTY